MTTFWRDKLVLICAPAHRLARKRRAALRGTRRRKIRCVRAGSADAQGDRQAHAAAWACASRRLEFDNIETVKRAVEIEEAVSIVPHARNLVSDEVRGGTLACVELDEPEMWRPLGVIVKSATARSRSLKEFLAMLETMDLGRP